MANIVSCTKCNVMALGTYCEKCYNKAKLDAYENVNKKLKKLKINVEKYYDTKKRDVNMARQDYKGGHLCAIEDIKFDIDELKSKLKGSGGGE